MSEAATAGVPAPSSSEVRRIVAIGDPVIRNLAITECYSRLAAAVAARTGEGANWCTFATWASRQAGRTIRGEDLLEDVESRLGRRGRVLRPVASLWRALLRRGLLRPETRLGRLTAELHTPFDAVEAASAAVARGNLRVFDEIGLLFARYLEECPPGAAPDGTELRRFLDSLRPGDPPDGQDYLRRAFARYGRRAAAPDAKARAELLCLANLEIGFHEQTRLQPEIRAAVDAGSATQEALGRRLLAALAPRTAGWHPALRGPAAAPLALAGRGLQRAAERVSREVVTEALMVLSLPGAVLRLGRHLEGVYPEALREPADVELVELLARWEPVPPTVDDCGARDWSELPQRMHYIVHLFRTYHERRELFDPPFTRQQVEAFSRGVVPAGEL